MTASDTIRRWRENPDQFVRDVFAVEPDLWQVDALQALGGQADPRRLLAMKACTGPGKSAVLAWIGWHRLLCFAREGEHPKGAALSVTADNLKDNLWAELAKWRSRSPLLEQAFTWTKERIYANDYPETWFLSARSFARDANAEAIGKALSGLHSQFPFILLDETGGMPVAVGKAARQIFTGNPTDALIAQAGNPTGLSGLLFESCNRGGWKVITITADPDDPKRTPRVSVEHAQSMIDEYGRDNPWVMATILGLFPPSGLNNLLSYEDVQAARRRQPKDNGWRALARILGVDVARYGLDSSVTARRQGQVLFPMQQARNLDSLQGAGWVTRFYNDFEQDQRRLRADMAFVDDTGGWGAGWIDQLRSMNYLVRGVPFAGKADDPRFYNKRSEMHWRLAEWVKTVGCLPDDDELAAELTAHTFSYRGDRLWVLEKEMVKEALGRSPDKADAAAITFAYDVAAPAGRAADGTDSRVSNLLAAVQESYGDPGKAGQPYNPMG